MTCEHEAALRVLAGAVEGGIDHPWIPGAAFTPEVMAAVALVRDLSPSPELPKGEAGENP